MTIPSYGKVWAIGHRAVSELFDAPVVVQEKVDGSQFSFANLGGELHMRSKGRPVHLGNGDKLFTPAMETATRLMDEGRLPEGVVFRGETLCSPKHNALQYNRVPKGNIVLFDAHTLDQTNVASDPLPTWPDLEWVPTLYVGHVGEPRDLLDLLATESFLGGTLIEGFVAKRYDVFDQFGTPLKGKYVSEAFKETAAKEWKQANPGRQDVVAGLIAGLRQPRRWEKAIEHLRDDGMLDGSPKDIGPLIKAVQTDVLEECEDTIKQVLFDYFKKDIVRGVTGGLPEWYKDRLLAEAFA